MRPVGVMPGEGRVGVRALTPPIDLLTFRSAFYERFKCQDSNTRCLRRELELFSNLEVIYYTRHVSLGGDAGMGHERGV